MVETARLESVYTGNRIGGSNPSLSAIFFVFSHSTVELDKQREPQLLRTFERLVAEHQRLRREGASAKELIKVDLHDFECLIWKLLLPR